MTGEPLEDEHHEQHDEHTPLISQSVDGSTFRNPFGDRGRTSFRNSLPSFSYLRASSSSSSSSDSASRVDLDDLQLSLARVGSLSSGTGLEPGRPQLEYGSYSSGKSIKPADQNNLRPEIAIAEPVEAEEDVHEGEEEESKYIGISPKRFWLVFSVIMFGIFLACFDSTLMASSHPVITSYFNASKSASWLSTVFLISSTAFQPLFGRVSDTIGRKPVFLLSFLIFALTTLWCALAGSIGSFIAARAVCGLGAGGTMSMSSIIMSDLVRIENRGVFQSHVNFAFGLGSAGGAAFGGFLCDTLGWRWAFGVQVPCISICFVMAMLFTPSGLGPMLIRGSAESKGGPWLALKNFDSTGSLLLLVSVSSLILALNLGGNLFPWVSAVVLGSFGVFVVSTSAFVVIERRAKQAVMPLTLLTKSPVANMVTANFLGAIATNTVLFNVPLFFQAVLLTSASSSGFRLAVPSLVGSGAGISTGYIITYTRRLKPTLVLGAIIYVVGSIAIMFLNKNTSEIASLVLITGVPLGQGFVFPSTLMSALAVSEQAHQAVITTTLGLWRSLGVVMGVAISSLIFQNCLATNLERLVVGPEKGDVIRRVRSSVGAIKKLPAPYQVQVIDAYAASLKVTFACAVAASVVQLVIVFTIKLPRLRRGRKVVVDARE